MNIKSCIWGTWGCVAFLFLFIFTQTGFSQAVPFAVSFWYPTNHEVFTAPANIGVHALVTDSNVVQTMQYYSGATLIGTVTNKGGLVLTNLNQDSPFFMAWSNVTAGSYTLTAVAKDSGGNTATSAPAYITVSNAPPPVIRPAAYIYSPTNNSMLLAPANVNIYARAAESGGQVATVQFFANSISLGVVSNSSQMVFTNVSSEPLYTLAWSNVLAGSYALKVLATDTNGNTATSSVVNISVVTNFPTPVIRPSVAIYSPTNGTKYTAPAMVNIYARAVETTGTVATVQFFANSTSLGVVSNGSQVVVSNISSEPVFPLTWSNAPAGNYYLKAVATDTGGIMATSALVSISIVSNSPPPIVPFAVGFFYPTNGQMFGAPANIGIHARVTDSNVVERVQYYSGNMLIGTVSNTTGVLLTNTTQANPFFMVWSNVSAGNYSLTAVAIDSGGNIATSGPVNITVTNVPPPVIPFAVSFFYPTNGQLFASPANIGVHARVTDSNVVEFVQYYSGNTIIGTVSNTSGILLTNSTQYNPFFLDWSNVPAGNYTLTAVATDSGGNMATSGPVNIYVLTNFPTVSIYAPDPVAIEGTNYGNWFTPTTCVTNYICGTNTATFLVRRDSDTNVDLAVYYSIGGTASNGVDYVTIPNNVVIPTGKRYALVTIIPLADNDSSYRSYDTVVLSLTLPTNDPPAYLIASPSRAGAVILEENFVPIIQPMIRNLADNSIHVSLPGTNGLNFSLQISTDMVNWLPVCTNTVLKGSAQFVDPNNNGNSGLYYRIVPVDTPASY